MPLFSFLDESSRIQPMFESDSGDKGVRSMVHGWKLTKDTSSPHVSHSELLESIQ